MITILLIGAGRFGIRLAKELSGMNVQIMAVDKNEDRLKEIEPYVTSAQIGDSTNVDFLRSLGIGNYDKCVVAIGDDYLSSLETTSLLKELGARYVFARAAKSMQENLLLRNGADEVVFPEKQMAVWSAMRVGSDNIFDYLELNDGYAVFETAVPPGWIDHSLGELNIRKKYHLNVLAVKNDGGMEITLGPEFVFSENEIVLLLGSQEDVHRCFGKKGGRYF